MGRHTADIRSDRATRQQFDHPVVSERRAAQNRTRTAGSSVALAAPAPKSVADNRVSPDLAHAMPVTPSDPRVVQQRRAWAAKAPVATTSTRTTTLNGFMRRRATIPALSFFAVSLMAGGSLFNPLQADVAQAAVTTPVLTKAPRHRRSSLRTAPTPRSTSPVTATTSPSPRRRSSSPRRSSRPTPRRAPRPRRSRSRPRTASPPLPPRRTRAARRRSPSSSSPPAGGGATSTAASSRSGTRSRAGA